MSNKEGPPYSPEHSENLQRYLLVPRKPRGFKEINGRVEPINSDSDMTIPPVVTVDIPYATLVGVRSGTRSGLLSVESADGEKAVKVKGCRLLSALKAKGPYRVSHIHPSGKMGGSPEGGLTLSAVEREIDNTLFFNELLTEEGFPVPYEPLAIIHYGKMFEPEGRSEYAEELAASVMQVKGDTRLAELYRLKAINIKAARRVAHRLGLMAGAQKRATNWSYWQDSDTVGNYVVFFNSDQLHLAPVDFEDTCPYKNVDILEEEQRLLRKRGNFDYPVWLNRSKELNLSEAPNLERYTIALIFGSMNKSSLSFVEGTRPSLKSTAQYISPGYFRKEFKKGFEVGYKNPDKRESLTRTDLHAAYDLAA